MSGRKLIIVTDCMECPHCFSPVLFNRECSLTGKSVLYTKRIPDWCPLPDAPKVIKRKIPAAKQPAKEE